MKTRFVVLLAAALLTGCSRVADPAPAPAAGVVAAGAFYTGPSGVVEPLPTCGVFSATAPPLPNEPFRRAVSFSAVLPDGTGVDISYQFAGSVFNTATNETVELDAPVRLNHVAAGTGAVLGQVFMPASGTTFLRVVAPGAVSGSYVGPLQTNGPTVTIIFNQLRF